MRKKFDEWNRNKKHIHDEGLNKLYHEREIWWCALGVNVGFEQDGTSKEAERPVLVLKGFSKDVCLVVPLTTSAKENPYHFALGKVDGKEAFVIVSQIRLVDTRRFVNKIGFVDKDMFQKIRKVIKDLL
ncbi:MAG: type II toxin-antitoxin system PemK/MazF family toxin [Candidatus Parcubacteria bacterium]|nr:type II toxin-antitoxin system PemK/MazF family toxin [Candidatus Parcubacteria bacterium]